MRRRLGRCTLENLGPSGSKGKSSKSREEDQIQDVRGIVRRAGECKPV